MIKNRIDLEGWLVQPTPLHTQQPPDMVPYMEPDVEPDMEPDMGADTEPYTEPYMGPYMGPYTGAASGEWIKVAPCTSIQLALYPDNPYWGDNLRDINQKAWFYRQTFTIPEVPHRRTRLQFDGVDYFATIYVNGQQVGEHEGAFVPFTLDVSDAVHAGENTLIVRVTSPWDPPNPKGTYPSDHVLRGLVKGLYEHGEGVIPPNVNPLGIFRPVWLVLDDGISIDHIQIQTQLDGEVDLCLHITHTGDDAWHGLLRSTITADNHSGEGVSLETSISLHTGQHTIQQTLNVPEPQLWWPWDHGKPCLYRLTVSLDPVTTDTVSEVSVATKSVTFGIREVELQRSSKQFTYLINKRPIAIRGTSYMPGLYMSQVTTDQLQRDVEIAHIAHLNLLRVHVHVSPPELYDLCDRMGILIMQDFELSWIHDPSPEFEARALKLQAAMIAMLANHPSIITWVCHNEPTMIFTRRQNLEKHPDPALYEAATQQDSTRPVFICSGQNERDWRRAGDSHTYFGALWTKRYIDIYKHTHYKFHTEFGFEAPAAPQTLRRYNDTWERLGHLAPQTEALWRYQAELIRYHVEHLRRLRAKGCAGYIHFWLVDLVPQVGCGVLDAKRIPKGGYEALKKASRPLHVALEHNGKRAIALWVFNDTVQVYKNAVVSWVVFGANQESLTRGEVKVDITANESQWVCPVYWDDCSRVELTLKSSTGKLLADNQYLWPFRIMKRPKGYPWKFDAYLGCKVFNRSHADSLADVSNNAIVHILPTWLREIAGEWVLRQNLPNWLVRRIAVIVDLFS